MSERVAAIDIGTNSVLLLVAERRGGEVAPVVERATITRLGKGVDKTRALDPLAIDRTLACLSDYAAVMRAEGVARVDAVGTSALRDAQGGADFIARAREILGVAPRVISGQEEARLTFAGALAGIPHADEPVLVYDIGGGSTEIIVGGGGEAPRGVSVDVGSVRLTERHVRSDPPSATELDAIATDVRRALATAKTSLGALVPARLVGVAGTVTTIAAFVNDVAPYDATRVHGSRLTAREVDDALARLAAMSLADRRAERAIEPARADVIVAGAVIAREVIRWAERDATWISDRGVRWGLALEMI